MDELRFEQEPHLVSLKSIGDPSIGYITISEIQKDIPFEIKRVYWTYYTPQNVKRGYHAHKKLRQIIFAVSGNIRFTVECQDGKKHVFVLDQPHVGLYLPPYTWREIQFSHNAVLLCLASEWFEESDYIREYNIFKNEACNNTI
ncbi:sugar 3,4-ketoisomerase [Longitalea luteola]|uniref:sugar 3,4-ketoisomerase n=1 Tax=Longitalea luteola TaxID=2812563 RepID=UPI001A9609B0|nr:FdtA/QdtA family cupin domain-containing protein [Longitalea luteola]